MGDENSVTKMWVYNPEYARCVQRPSMLPGRCAAAAAVASAGSGTDCRALNNETSCTDATCVWIPEIEAGNKKRNAECLSNDDLRGKMSAQASSSIGDENCIFVKMHKAKGMESKTDAEVKAAYIAEQ